MRAARLTLVILFASVSLVVIAWGVAANASGAPASAAQNGCTCHSPQPGPLASVSLTGLPAQYLPGERYSLTVAVEGSTPPGLANQGGFAVSADGGSFAPVDDRTQFTDGVLTHTAAGNDQRSWKFDWIAPANGTGPVKFSYAANAVDGNMGAEPGDQWAKSTAEVPLGAATNPTTPAPTPTQTGEDTPGAGGLLLVVAFAAAFALRRRA